MDVPPPPSRTPSALRQFPVTCAIIAANVAVFLYEQTLSASASTLFEIRWALIPLRFTEPDKFVIPNSAGNGTEPLPPPFVNLLTSAFLHSGMPHILLNMFFLYAIGRMVEQAIGSGRYTLIYFLAALGSGLVSLAARLGQFTVVLGASGAIYGVFAAYILLLPPGSNRNRTLIWVFALEVIPAIIPPDVILRLTGSDFLASVDHFGHIGGFLTGGAVMYVLLLRARQRRAQAASIYAPPDPTEQPGD